MYNLSEAVGGYGQRNGSGFALIIVLFILLIIIGASFLNTGGGYGGGYGGYGGGYGCGC